MKKIVCLVAAIGVFVMQSCNAQPAEVQNVSRATDQVREPRLTLTDFTDVAAATINGVVHIKTEMTQMTPLYQSFFGFIIQQGVQKQVYNAYGSGVIVTSAKDTAESCHRLGSD